MCNYRDVTEHVELSTGPTETVLPDPDPELLSELEAANDEGRVAIARVVGRYPTSSLAWAQLAASTEDEIEAYAYARVGYHRGLDALRGAGWRGTGYVRWANESNRGFLACLDILRKQAGAIGEQGEAERCSAFLRQLDPSWTPTPETT